MVYIEINNKIQELLPKNMPKSVRLLQIDNIKYLSYKDFKQISKKIKTQLYKYIHRKEIIADSQMHHRLQLKRRSPLQKKLIQELRNRQQFKKNNPSLADQISFLYNQTIYQAKSENLSNQVYSLTKLIFGMCISTIVGYLVAHNGLGLDFLWSIYISGLLAGGFYLCKMITKADKYLEIRATKKSEIRTKKKSKQSSATIEFGSEMDNFTTINSKGKLKRK